MIWLGLRQRIPVDFFPGQPADEFLFFSIFFLAGRAVNFIFLNFAPPPNH